MSRKRLIFGLFIFSGNLSNSPCDFRRWRFPLRGYRTPHSFPRTDRTRPRYHIGPRPRYHIGPRPHDSTTKKRPPALLIAPGPAINRIYPKASAHGPTAAHRQAHSPQGYKNTGKPTGRTTGPHSGPTGRKKKPRQDRRGRGPYLFILRRSASTTSGKIRIHNTITFPPPYANVKRRVSVVRVYFAAISGNSFLIAVVSIREETTAL